MKLSPTLVSLVFSCLFSAASVFASVPQTSVYSQAFEDPETIDLSTGTFEIHDGEDITATLQSAADYFANNGVFGVIQIPSGTYFITDTINVWKGIRLIGYGPQRPTFKLPDNTPGYASGEPKYMFHYAHNKPDPGEPFKDATPGTFYSAFSNINVDMGTGNTSAVAIRSKWAQHSYISHVRFDIRDALAAVQKVGNIMHDCEFIGGSYGIMTTKPSPSWPFPMLDSHFSGQSKAAIITEETGLTLVRCTFDSAPVAIQIRKDRSEELVIEDCRFSSISEAIMFISEPDNARTQVNIINSYASDSPTIARFSNQRKAIQAPTKEIYQIKHFSHGLHLSNAQPIPQIETRVNAAAVNSFPQPSDGPERQLPNSSTWFNIRSLGAKGDGVFDNTHIFKQAIEEHEVIFIPEGLYRIRETLKLKPNTCVVGLSPITTQLVLQDEEPAFNDPGQPLAVVESAKAGTNILQGFGIDAGGNNPGAIALKWMGTEASVINDVRLIGGHGSFDTEGNYVKFYNNNRSADSDPRRRWGAMPASLWVTENGGGTFKNIWTPSPFAHAGLLVENTSTPGYTYQISSEHHVRNEFILRNVHNWKFYVSQFEEEMWEGRNTLPLQIQDCSNLSFNNTYVYRVMRTFTPFSHGIEIENSTNINFYGIHAYGPSKFTVDDTVKILDTNTGLRSREIAHLEIEDTNSFVIPSDEFEYEVLASGFNHIDSPELDSAGQLYFVDERKQKIWKWNTESNGLEMILDSHLEPSQIFLENDESLVILSRTGKIYRKDLNIPGYYDGIQRIDPIKNASESIENLVLPTTRWRDNHDFLQVTTESKPYSYELANATLPSEENYPEASIYTTWFRTLDLVRTYDLASVKPNSTVYVSDEFAQKTWSFQVQKDGRLGEPTLFAEEGEAGVICDPETGNVYVSAGDIFVYNPQGDLMYRMTPPSRPGPLQIFKDKSGVKHLYILSRDRLLRTKLSDQK